MLENKAEYFKLKIFQKIQTITLYFCINIKRVAFVFPPTDIHFSYNILYVHITLEISLNSSVDYIIVIFKFQLSTKTS